MYKKVLLIGISMFLFMNNVPIKAQQAGYVSDNNVIPAKKICLDDSNIVISLKNNTLTAEFAINNPKKLEYNASFYVSIVSADNKIVVPAIWYYIPFNTSEKYLPEVKIKSSLTKEELKNAKIKFSLKSTYLSPSNQCFGKGGCYSIDESTDGEKNISDLLN